MVETKEIEVKEPEDFYKKYPALFPNPVEISVGHGWYELIDNALSSINHYARYNVLNHKDFFFHVAQIKEKFGALRFYHDGGDRYTDGIVNMTERFSSMLCEECGEKGQTRPLRWIKCLCNTHFEERKQYIERLNSSNKDENDSRTN